MASASEMPILWFKFAKHHFLSSHVMAMGMLLACFAWLMQLSPLLAPLWLDVKKLQSFFG
ncbi:hypothetical protein LAJ61_01155 [Moraxella osloensis]|nr:hypothetical protein [Moraxella osloensis]UAY37343.1 hypothetical protein LAJ61_01155 [Moraxella osloensis]